MSDVTPAMTAEEWARHRSDAVYQFPLETRLSWAGSEVGQGGYVSRHALAALALHGQAYGFTHDDVKLCVWAAQKLRGLTNAPEDWVDLDYLAARLAALLPPEGTNG